MASNQAEEQLTNESKKMKALEFEIQIVLEVVALTVQLGRAQQNEERVPEPTQIEKNQAFELEIKMYEEIKALLKILRRSEKRRQQYEEDFGVMYEECGEFIENVMNDSNGGSFNNVVRLVSRSARIRKHQKKGSLINAVAKKNNNEKGIMLIGLAACAITSVAFGSVFVPIKKFPPSDGFMSQFFMCTAGFLVSFAIHALQNFPPIFPLAMIGGSIWCIGNSCAFMIMNKLGMALGILIWNSVSCLTGWATARYGLFGVAKSVPNSEIMNYVGVVILVIGSLFYLFIKSTLHHHHEKSTDSEIAEKVSVSSSSATENSEEIHLEITHEVPILHRIM
ncbi:unnamed protein product [Caenorhabditis angaria]|uniref:Transmembrane protein 144 n=1 Tax=Caenorhabditis angaria TaxID=860376 RepID=A0A9P1MS73_9PELO|nr:unnamed protein product [Caenorhabditis angaria]